MPLTILNVPKAKRITKLDAIIVDLDGTFVHDPASSTVVYSDPTLFDWASWHKTRADLPTNEWCTNIIDMYANHMDTHIVYLTSRGYADGGLEVATRWLKKNSPTEHYELYMRPDGVHTKDTEFKLDVYKRIIEPKFNILLAIDDKIEVCNMWQQEGINTLYCGDMLLKR